jgi:hydrogenase maturation protease
MSGRHLFVGIGSPHGDDQIGWLVARHVAKRSGDELVARCAQSPAEILDLLDSQTVGRLEVCDAVRCAAPTGSVFCWSWPDAQIAREQFYGSHDLSLPAALELAEALGRLPCEVRIWGVAVDATRSFADVTPQVRAAIVEIGDRILLSPRLKMG